MAFRGKAENTSGKTESGGGEAEKFRCIFFNLFLLELWQGILSN
ncbi:MAG: hypothetical protein H6Q14_176 [Bacteroidetes bacterium]|jgi:hypothetical protein|nr:hypothetical protein [Bacteroidota bacterium]